MRLRILLILAMEVCYIFSGNDLLFYVENVNIQVTVALENFVMNLIFPFNYTVESVRARELVTKKHSCSL
jgi:hypothetical protein